MNAREFDPRAITSSTVAGAYAVIFWAEDAGLVDGVPIAPEAEEWLLSDVEVDEVLDWARSLARGRHVEILALMNDSADYVAVRLLGRDPTET